MPPSLIMACHATGEEIEQLWHEYEQGTSPAAQLVKDFDKVHLAPPPPSLPTHTPVHSHALCAASISVRASCVPPHSHWAQERFLRQFSPDTDEEFFVND